MFHCCTVCFWLGMLCPLTSCLAFSPSLDLSGCQGITTRCSENWAVTDTSFKIPPNRLQSFLYRHQYGKHNLVRHNCDVVFKWTLSWYSEIISTPMPFCVILWQLVNNFSVQGLVNHGTSHGLKAPPKFYRFQEAGVRPVDVSAIHFSPFRQHLFLVRVQFFDI